jgi:hypothetical protein
MAWRHDDAGVAMNRSGPDSRNVTARELPSGERENLFGRITELASGFAEYQAKTTRVIPVFELQPAS